MRGQVAKEELEIGGLASLARGKDREVASLLHQQLTFGHQFFTHDRIMFFRVTRAGRVEDPHDRLSGEMSIDGTQYLVL